MRKKPHNGAANAVASLETTARHRAATNVPTRESAMVLISDGAGGSSGGLLLPSLLLVLSLAAMVRLRRCLVLPSAYED